MNNDIRNKMTNPLPEIYPDIKISYQIFYMGGVKYKVVTDMGQKLPYSLYHLKDNGTDEMIAEAEHMGNIKQKMKAFYRHIQRKELSDEQFNEVETRGI